MSFILTTPGVWQEGYSFPFLSPMPGQFLAKDVVLLAAANSRSAERNQASDDDRSLGRASAGRVLATDGVNPEVIAFR